MWKKRKYLIFAGATVFELWINYYICFIFNECNHNAIYILVVIGDLFSVTFHIFHLLEFILIYTQAPKRSFVSITNLPRSGIRFVGWLNEFKNILFVNYDINFI